MREITLSTSTRYFKEIPWGTLARTDKFLSAGTKLLIGGVVTRFYDHRNQAAVSFKMDEDEFFFLVDELGLPEFAN